MEQKMVSAAIIRRDGKILIARKPNKDRWSLPGGTANNDEGPQDTLLRELNEEFPELRIKGAPRLFRHFPLSATNPHEVYIFLANVSGEATPNPVEIAEARWIFDPIVESYNLPPQVVRALLSLRIRPPPPEIFDWGA